MQHLLPQFDLAIHASKSESGPLVLIEYMAQSLPFITYKTGEVANQLKKDLPEFIMQNFDDNEWAQHIKVLLQMDKKILQDRLQNVFEKNYSSDSCALWHYRCILFPRRLQPGTEH